MSEYDAFGRKKDDAGLGDLGWGSSGDPNAAPNPEQPTVSATPADSGFSSPAEFSSVPTGPPPIRRRKSGRPFIALVQLMVLGGIGLAIYFAVDAGNDAADKVRGAIDSFNTITNPDGSTTRVDQGDDTVPEQVKARKLFTPGGLRSAVKILEKEYPGRITNFSMRRDRMNVQVTQRGKSLNIGFNADAEAPELFSSSTAIPGGDTISYEEINFGAPQRLMKAANARLGQSESDVDYFVLSKFSGALTWGVYYKGGKPIAQGDSRGRYTRRIS